MDTLVLLLVGVVAAVLCVGMLIIATSMSRMGTMAIEKANEADLIRAKKKYK